ncbi:hypothetical protein [Mycolicibacter senuensis]|uniref:hypothetical protein n=1 Tax=Mycolicibacter senuensis TaxID=386913 RepID=UPI001A99428F|nr:hypothetical protein [Mycolicibacter senuensis]
MLHIAGDEIAEVGIEEAAPTPVVGPRYCFRKTSPDKPFGVLRSGNRGAVPPGPDDRICGLAKLTALDMATGKLLANSDRWADRSVSSRDVIDLAMMEPGPGLLNRAIAKAETAYRSAIVDDLRRAIDYLRDNPHRLDDCMLALQMYDTPKAVLWDRIKRLRP